MLVGREQFTDQFRLLKKRGLPSEGLYWEANHCAIQAVDVYYLQRNDQKVVTARRWPVLHLFHPSELAYVKRQLGNGPVSEWRVQKGIELAT
jgi:hypothetical protein